MKNKKEIIIKKSIDFPKRLSGFITIFLVVLICLNLVGLIYVLDKVGAIQNEIIRMDKKIESVESGNTGDVSNSNEEANDYYRELSDKTDDAIDRILAIVGSLATIVTFFGLLLTYKAPHDMDKRLDEIKNVGTEAKEAAETAKYQAEILEAINVDYNGYLTNEIRIKQLSDIIEKYPNKSDAYMHRAFLYDKISEKYSDERKIEYLHKAITDYKIASDLGGEKSACLMDIGVAYSNLGEQHKAIQYYDKAIKLNPDSAAAYGNRGVAYGDIGKYDDSLKDFEKAIGMDDEGFEYYIGRSYTYNSLWKRAIEIDKQNDYIDLQIADLQKAIDLNPENPVAKNLLVELYAELKKFGIYKTVIIDVIIAQMNEKKGDVRFRDSDYTEAYKCYLKAMEYNGKIYLNENANNLNSIERIANRMDRIDINTIDCTKLHVIQEMTSRAMISCIAIKAYIEKERRIAEILFLILVKYGEDVAALNLAFMKRRSETKKTKQSVEELLNMYKNKESAIWCINKALWYMQKENNTSSINEAVKIVKMSKMDYESAIGWWSDENVVGKKEKNIVFLLIALSKVFDYKDDVDLKERIKIAKEDGYNIPDDFESRYDEE